MVKGIGACNIYTDNRVQLTTGVNASLMGEGYLVLGLPSGLNLVADRNEIQARNTGAVSGIFFQAEGGKTQLGKTSDANIKIENASIQALYNGAAETLILQGAAGH